MAASPADDIPITTSTVPCDICYDYFDAGSRRPKVLRCGHTFCLACVRRLVGLARGPVLRCPACNTNVVLLPPRGVAGEAGVDQQLPTNYRLLTYAAETAKMAAPAPAGNGRQLSDGDKTKMAEGKICAVHSAMCEEYCMTCMEALCAVCFKDIVKGKMKPHVGHTMVDIAEVVDSLKKNFLDYRRQITDLFGQDKDPARDKFDDFQETLIKGIQEQVTNAHKKIDEWERGLLFEASEAFVNHLTKTQLTAINLNDVNMINVHIKNAMKLLESRESCVLRKAMDLEKVVIAMLEQLKNCKTVSGADPDIRFTGIDVTNRTIILGSLLYDPYEEQRDQHQLPNNHEHGLQSDSVFQDVHGAFNINVASAHSRVNYDHNSNRSLLDKNSSATSIEGTFESFHTNFPIDFASARASGISLSDSERRASSISASFGSLNLVDGGDDSLGGTTNALLLNNLPSRREAVLSSNSNVTNSADGNYDQNHDNLNVLDIELLCTIITS